MWKTFWGDDFDRLAPSNSKAVVPGNWRMEVTPSEAAADDRFLHVLEIGDRGAAPLDRVEPLEGHRLVGAVAGAVIVLFARDREPPLDGEVTLPNTDLRALYVAGLQPGGTYELQWTTLGIPRGRSLEVADEAGVVHLETRERPAERLRLRLQSPP
jgi:hypothetical protein